MSHSLGLIPRGPSQLAARRSVRLAVGTVSRFLLPGRDPMELLATMGLGVAGSFAMGSVFHVLFASSNEGVQPSGFIGSVIGGILLLVAARSWKRKDAAAS